MNIDHSIIDKAFSVSPLAFLAGDFNAKTVKMGFERNNNTGLTLSDFIDEKSISTMNDSWMVLLDGSPAF